MGYTKAILLAAGMGSRLRPLTDQVPKCLLPVAGLPLLAYWIHELSRAGIYDVLINTHAHRDQVRQYIDQVKERGGIRMTESFEPQLLGSAGTICANESFVAESGGKGGADQIVIVYADNFSTVDLTSVLAFHNNHADPLTMLLFHSPSPSTCGIVVLDESSRILEFQEKPTHPASNLANAGLYVMDAPDFHDVACMGAFDLGFDVLPRFVGRMRGFILNGYHCDIGTPAAYEQVQARAQDLVRESGSRCQRPRPAVFFDRDGTLIESVPYLSEPSMIKLVPGVGAAIQRLRAQGFAIVLVTNQSAVGRGIITEPQLRKIHETMCVQLAHEGVALDGIYHCPIEPQISDRTVVEHEDRKPGPGMLLRAATELSLDLRMSWMVGDMVSDALAGRNAGCRGSILLPCEQSRTSMEHDLACDFETVENLVAAAEMIISRHRAAVCLSGTR